MSGEGGRPFGLERYGKAFFVAWYCKHRAALGEPLATIRGLAAKEGITGRFRGPHLDGREQAEYRLSDSRNSRRPG